MVKGLNIDELGRLKPANISGLVTITGAAGLSWTLEDVEKM